MSIRVANIQDFDVVDSIDGFTVSLWIAGCPIRCKGCHNPELWNEENYPKISVDDLYEKLKSFLSKDKIKKNLSILGGEPFGNEEHIESLNILLEKVKKDFPDISIYIWTGFYLKDLKKNKTIRKILKKVDYLIDGPFIEEQKKILKLRGSENQSLYKKSFFGFKKLS